MSRKIRYITLPRTVQHAIESCANNMRPVRGPHHYQSYLDSHYTIFMLYELALAYRLTFPKKKHIPCKASMKMKYADKGLSSHYEVHYDCPWALVNVSRRKSAYDLVNAKDDILKEDWSVPISASVNFVTARRNAICWEIFTT